MTFILLFIVSFLYFARDISEYHKVKKTYAGIKEKAEDNRTESIDWEALWKVNRDIVAWLKIPETKVDYPVVQTKNNSEYLSRDINGDYSIYGAIFLDERLYGTDLGTNPNNIIYGHNMGRWTDVMFGTLKEYLSSPYLKGHERVILYAPEGTYHYRIASVAYATESSDIYKTEFKETVFTDWVKEQTEKSLYRCSGEDIINAYADRFSGENPDKKELSEYGNTLTLSTCDTTHGNDKKIVIFCIPENS